MHKGPLPPWWNAWTSLVPRLALAADGEYRPEPGFFDSLHAQGFDTRRLRVWQPTQKDGRRLKTAYYTVRKVLQIPAASIAAHKQQVNAQLRGEGVWADLRCLADAYLDGQRGATAPAQAGVPRPQGAARVSQKRIQAKQVTQDLSGRKRLRPTIGGFTALIEDAGDLTIYIDETWSGETAAIQRNEGVIAGLVCRGKPQTFADLPQRATHRYAKPLQAREAIEQLWRCRSCAPFIFPMRLPDPDEPASRYYDALLQQAIRFLLGWLLPLPVKPVRLHLFPEAMQQCQHPVGDDRTEFYRGLLAADPARYGQWQIETMRWETKDFGYIPYADLAGYLTLEHTDYNKVLGAWADFKQLPGYVPFSLGLVPRLERLEHFESAACLQDVIDFAVETGDSPFGHLVLRDLAARMAPRLDLQLVLLETLEAGYQDKVRDLVRLRRAFAAVRGLLPTLPALASPRMRLLWYLLAMQDANHHGDPERIRATAADYVRERATLMQVERELCAYADLNLAVHAADRFEFESAQQKISDWVTSPLFAALSLHQRGRMYSALGQYRAMQGDAHGAEALFDQALVHFMQAPLDAGARAREQEQTAIYMAINALDGEGLNARRAVEAVVGPLTVAMAVDFAADETLENQFRHHLLVRALCQLDDLAEVRDAYLDRFPTWRDGHLQHPWPSIHGHRGFLLWNRGEETGAVVAAAQAAFDRAIAVAALADQGPTVKLIGALWATVAACCFANAGYEEQAGALLEDARVLAGAHAAVATLEAILADPDPQAIPMVLTLLPFNYR